MQEKTNVSREVYNDTGGHDESKTQLVNEFIHFILKEAIIFIWNSRNEAMS